MKMVYTSRVQNNVSCIKRQNILKINRQQILNATSAVQAKQIVSEDCMYASMYAKFSQNEDLRSFLVKTNKTQLVEANPFDRIWGSGIPIHTDDIFKPEKWKGNNLAGKVLLRVQQTLQ